MAKISVKYNAKKASKKFKDRFNKFLREDDWKEEAFETAKKNIVGQTRLGKDIKSGEKLKKIKKQTEKDKAKWAQKNQAGISFSPGKSNLTRSGQLLESLKRGKSKTSVEIAPEGTRKPYKGQTKTITNKKLADYLSEKGFSFMGFNDRLKAQIKSKLLRHLRRSVLRK